MSGEVSDRESDWRRWFDEYCDAERKALRRFEPTLTNDQVTKLARRQGVRRFFAGTDLEDSIVERKLEEAYVKYRGKHLDSRIAEVLRTYRTLI